MAEPTMREILGRLEAQEAELAVLRRARRRGGRPRRGALALVALLVALVPLGLLAANPFVDLNAGSVHNANIDAIFNAGITTGCDPTHYCPNDVVTREAMASFLARTAGVGGNPPVTNAKTLQGYEPAGLVRLTRGDGGELALTATPQTVATATITAPAAGLVLVTSAVNIQTAFGSTCYAATRLRDATGNVNAPTYFTFLGSGEEQLASPTYVFEVSAGARTLQLQAAVQQPGCVASAYVPVIIALYVPFGGTGGTTLDLPEPPAQTPGSGTGHR